MSWQPHCPSERLSPFQRRRRRRPSPSKDACAPTHARECLEMASVMTVDVLILLKQLTLLITYYLLLTTYYLLLTTYYLLLNTYYLLQAVTLLTTG